MSMNGKEMYGEPTGFSCVNHIILHKLKYNLPYDIHMFEIIDCDLGDPSIDPILQYSYAGIMRYVFGDDEYTSVLLERVYIDRIYNNCDDITKTYINRLNLNDKTIRTMKKTNG